MPNWIIIKCKCSSRRHALEPLVLTEGAPFKSCLQKLVHIDICFDSDSGPGQLGVWLVQHLPRLDIVLVGQRPECTDCCDPKSVF